MRYGMVLTLVRLAITATSFAVALRPSRDPVCPVTHMEKKCYEHPSHYKAIEKTTSPAACCALCNADKGKCGSFSYYNNNGTCFLKPGPPTKKTHDTKKCNTTSGTMPTSPPAPPPSPIPDSAINITAGSFTWSFPRTAQGYSLGTVIFDGSPIEAPWEGGLLFASRGDNVADRKWLHAASARQLSPAAAEFRGSYSLGSGELSFSVTASAHHMPGAPGTTGTARVAFNTSWSVSAAACPYSLSIPLFGDTMWTPSWRSQMYPWAGNSTEVNQFPLQYVGVPAAVLFREDWRVAILHGLDPSSDYLNPTSWTGATGYSLASNKGPAYTFGGGNMSSSIDYSANVQLIFSSVGTMPGAVTELVSAWRDWNGYAVEHLHSMDADTALQTFLDGRRSTDLWIEGKGYKLQYPGKTFGSGAYISLASQSISAYLEYLVHVKTGDPLWRSRSFTQAEFILKAQNTNESSFHHGAIHSSFRLDKQIFTSNDRGHSPGLKTDLIAMISRYLLQLWAAVLEHEGHNQTEWYTSGLAAAKWVARQQNPNDHGLPNRIELHPVDNWDDRGTPSASVVSGRSLAGLPLVLNLTADLQVGALIGGLESFLRHHAEKGLWFTGQHPDLHGGDFEPNSVWGAVDYWLGKGDDLDRAVADANLGFLMLCPKQLSWVSNPTQLAFTEQQNYLQYSQYCYETKKVAVLQRLSRATGDPLWSQMATRFTQMNFLVMNTSEGNTKGAIHEAIADPWGKRRGGYDWTGTLYMDQLNTDLFLQLLEANATPPSPPSPPTPPSPGPAGTLNVLMLVIDDLRPLGAAFGEPEALMPNLDALADGSTIFTNAYASAATCGVSRSSLLTSRRPDTTRVFIGGDYNTNCPFSTDPAHKHWVSLPRYFRNHGYETAGAGKIWHPNVCDGALVGEEAGAWSLPYFHAPCIGKGSIYNGSCMEDLPFAPSVLPGGCVTSFYSNNSNCSSNATRSQEIVEEDMSDAMIAAHAVQMLKQFGAQQQRNGSSKPFFLAVGLVSLLVLTQILVLVLVLTSPPLVFTPSTSHIFPTLRRPSILTSTILARYRCRRTRHATRRQMLLRSPGGPRMAAVSSRCTQM